MKLQLLLVDLPDRDLRAAVDEDALDELAASMREVGQLQPIGVKEKTGDRFEVVYGARRTRAAQLIGWQEIEAVLVENNGVDNAHAKKLIENVQRLDMTPIEEAYGLLDLIGDGEINVRRLQQQTGKSREWVRTRLELAEMPEDLQGAVQAGVIGVGVARAFSKIQNETVREQYIKAAVENGCTADQAIVWASQASFAESGIMTMDQIQDHGDNAAPPPQVVDQQYHCFICGQMHSWRRVNTLVICGGCQDVIGTARTSAITDPIEYPVDTTPEPA